VTKKKDDRYRLNRFDSDCYQILNTEGKVVAFATRMSNNSWGLYSADDQRLSATRWAKPTDVLAKFIEIFDIEIISCYSTSAHT